MNFINRFELSEQMIKCICTGLYRICEGHHIDSCFEYLSNLEKKKLICEKGLFENYKRMKPNIKQNFYSNAKKMYLESHMKV